MTLTSYAYKFVKWGVWEYSQFYFATAHYCWHLWVGTSICNRYWNSSHRNPGPSFVLYLIRVFVIHRSCAHSIPFLFFLSAFLESSGGVMSQQRELPDDIGHDVVGTSSRMLKIFNLLLCPSFSPLAVSAINTQTKPFHPSYFLMVTICCLT